MRYLSLLAVVAGVIVFPLNVHAKEFEVSQKDKEFAPKALKIKTGDMVSFKNDDPFSHNVFSLSDTKTFDLGSYPQGQTRKITFDKPGTVEVECAIHPDMKITIEVQK
jgi:plastocyanin